MRNMATNPPTNPPIAPPAASSNPSGKRSAKARASRIPAANAAEYDRPRALSSPPSKATRLAPENPTAASTANTTALTGAAPETAPPATPRRSPSTPVPIPQKAAEYSHPRTAGEVAIRRVFRSRDHDHFSSFSRFAHLPTEKLFHRQAYF